MRYDWQNREAFARGDGNKNGINEGKVAADAHNQALLKAHTASKLRQSQEEQLRLAREEKIKREREEASKTLANEMEARIRRQLEEHRLEMERQRKEFDDRLKIQEAEYKRKVSDLEQQQLLLQRQNQDQNRSRYDASRGVIQQQTVATAMDVHRFRNDGLIPSNSSQMAFSGADRMNAGQI